MASRRAALAELRKNRAGGKTRLSSYQVVEEESLYDEVDEEGYKKVVRDRLDQDDFIVDDNGAGYVDDGREDWDEASMTGSEEEEARPVTGKAGVYSSSLMLHKGLLMRNSEAKARSRRREACERE